MQYHVTKIQQEYIICHTIFYPRSKGEKSANHFFGFKFAVKFLADLRVEIDLRLLPLTPIAGLNLLTDKVSRFSELSSEFGFWGSFSSNVRVNPVFSWTGQISFQRILPPYSQHLATPQICFEFSGFYYTSNSFLITPIKTNDRKTCPFREILSQRIGRGEDRVE